MSEFKLSRFRVTWKGAWTTGTAYTRDSVIQYGGKSYRCLVPHTANANFFTDLSSAYWTLMVDGKSFLGAWAPSTSYTTGSIVTYLGNVYVCTTNHTSGVTLDLSKFVTYIKGTPWTSVWTPSTTYGVGTVVKYGGIVYQATTQHTSNNGSVSLTATGITLNGTTATVTFATQSAALFAVGGTITLAGFTPAQTAGTVNNVNTTFTVTACTTTSVSFALTGTYTSSVLGTISGTSTFGLEIDQANWTIYNSGIEYKGAWTTATQYKLNDIVREGAEIFIVTTPHLSGARFDITKVTTWMPGIELAGTWNSYTYYQIGDVVLYGGYSYVNNTANNQGNYPAIDTTDWTLLSTGYELKGSWNSGTHYYVGDVVSRGARSYVCTQEHTFQDPLTVAATGITFTSFYYSTLTIALDATSTTTLTVGNTYSGSSGQTTTAGMAVGQAITFSTAIGLITSGTTYYVQSIVDSKHFTISATLGGGLYSINNVGTFSSSTTATVTTSTPILTVSSTSQLTPGMIVSGFGFTQAQEISSITNGTTLVLSAPPDGVLFAGQTMTFTGANSAYWALVSPGVIFQGKWNNSTQYLVGDVVYYKNITYACILNNSSQDPSADATNTYWVLYATNFKKNALVNQGDLLVYNTASAPTYSALPIGTNGNVLRATNNYPTWSTINVVPNVFYVATNGSDTNTGKSWDDPWATINYACTTIGAGLAYKQQGALLELNREFLAQETYYWMLSQKTGNISPFTSGSVFDQTITLTQIRELVDAVAYDLARGGNSQTVAQTLYYFTPTGSNVLTVFNSNYTSTYLGLLNSAIGQLGTLITSALGGTVLSATYQSANGVGVPVTFSTILSYVVVTAATTAATNLISITTTALTNQTTAAVPSPNSGLTATIMVKTGTYTETTPITVPENVALNGDELRSVVVQPSNIVNTVVTSVSTTGNLITVASITNIGPNTPVQFVGVVNSGGVSVTLGGLNAGQTYYVIGNSISGNSFQVSNQSGGTTPVTITLSQTGSMPMYGGGAIKNMFYVRNGSGIRNMTLTGLLGTLSNTDAYLISRPTGGAYVSLDPGTGVNDTSAWIFRRSPYVQNVTTFGTGCIGCKIDGTLHNGGNKSIVANDFTQVLSDGIGVWCTGTGALTELVSVFTYYNYISYFAENGGKVRATNGNSSYGTYGAIAEGYDVTETPITGNIYNQSSQVQATVQSAFGVSAQLLKLNYSNAGSGYNQPTTNLLNYSNNFLATTGFWTNDGYLTILKNTTALTGYSEAWTLTATSNTPGQGSFAGAISIPASATQQYTFSIYVKQGTATSVSILLTFAGGTSAGQGITVNLATQAITTFTSGSGVTPTSYGSQVTLVSGWYRIWISSVDPIGTNTILSTTVYPIGNNTTGVGTYNVFYGSQLEVSNSTFTVPYSPSFYLENTSTGRYTAYANNEIVGAGSNALLISDELRSNSVFQTRITTDSNSVTGGANYFLVQNTAQSGTSTGITISNSDIYTISNYIGMRIFINSGTGAGQYGYISGYNTGTRAVTVMKESFDPLVITTTTSGTNVLTVQAGQDMSGLYVGMPMQLVPSYYNTTVSATGLSSQLVTAAIGGTTNTLTVSSTSQLAVGMAINFTGTTFSTITTGYTYYIIGIPSSTSIQVSSTFGGTTWVLTAATGSMTMNYPSYNNYLTATSTTNMSPTLPIQFTGTSFGGLTVSTTYYINNVIDSYNFTISATQVQVTGTATSNSNNGITVSSTSPLVALNPIVFSGVTFGNIVAGTTYYIGKIIDGFTFSVASSLLSVNCTATTTGTNYITVASTTGFQQYNPIMFVGSTFGGIVSGNIYYIAQVVDSGTIKISTDAAGSNIVNLTTASGLVLAKTCPAPFALTNASGTMSGTSTGAIYPASFGSGTLNAQFYTSLFGGVTNGATYYINTFNTSTRAVTVTATQGSGTPITLSSSSGIMSIAALGWDHVIPGTPILSALDGTSVYYIEPRPQYTDPAFTQTSAISTVTLGSGSWQSIASGGNYFLAIPSTGTAGAKSPDGSTWTAMTLPANLSWTSIAYGNGYWVAVASGTATCYYSTNNGTSWISATLPVNTTWTSVTYGNGVFVAVASGTTYTAYSTNFGANWTVAYLPGPRGLFTATGNAQISTAQQKIGPASLYLDGTTNTYVQSPSGTDYALGTGDFTIEAWVYRTGNAGVNQVIVDFRSSGSAAVAPTLYLNTTYVPIYLVNGTTAITGSAAVALNTWTHIAISRTSSSTTMWVNGTQSGSTYSDSNNYIQSPVTIGANPAGASYFSGYIDELRIEKGVGKYTTTFTPSTTAFASDANTVALLHFEGANTTTSMVNSAGSPTWIGLSYGLSKYLAITSSSTAAYSPDGFTWYTVTLPTTGWTGLAYGNNRFVAVGGTNSTIYSFNGSTWYTSPTTPAVSLTSITYGQGAFLALSSTNTTAYIGEDGFNWKLKSVIAATTPAVAFGFAASTFNGVFTLLSGTSTGTTISAGIRAKARSLVQSGVLYGIAMWEPGSGYTSTPTITITDPNVTILATTQVRTSNGTLGGPSFVNSGTGYNTNSTTVTVNGNGFGDNYQVGYSIILNNLTSLPTPGNDLTITGISTIYKVTSSTAVYGTTAPNYQAVVQLSPSITNALSPTNGASISIRTKYSQVRLTNHDYLDVGYGNFTNANYPNSTPLTGYGIIGNNQAVSINYGRVFFTSTDQDGNFSVGGLFGVQQATGIVTISATQFGLQGLSSLQLGGIAVGGNSTIINQFSTDSTFTANSDAIIPTQRAIKAYLAGILGQGGSNTYTGQLIAGTTSLGATNIISNTQGLTMKIPVKVNFNGANAGVDGNMMALEFFARSFNHRSPTF